MGNHDRQPEQILTRSTRAQECVGAPDFGEVGVETASRTALVWGHFTGVRVVGQRQSPVAMLASQRRHGRFGQLQAPERPERIEHPVGSRIAGMDGHQGPVHEIRQIRKLGAVLVASTTNLLDGVPLDLPGEHCQTGEQVALAGGQEPVGPVDDIGERAVALDRGPAALVQGLVGLLQRVAQPAQTHDRDPSGRQLQSQWEAVDALGDLGDKGHVLRLRHPARRSRLNPVDQQGDSPGLIERGQCQHVLAVRTQRFPARQQKVDAVGRLPDGLNESRHCFDQVLAGIEHDQLLAHGEHLDDPSQECLTDERVEPRAPRPERPGRPPDRVWR